MKGFGMSISGNVDVDGNGMLDLAIGASESGSAVVLRTLEVMKLSTSFRFQTLSNGLIQPKDDSEQKHNIRY